MSNIFKKVLLTVGVAALAIVVGKTDANAALQYYHHFQGGTYAIMTSSTETTATIDFSGNYRGSDKVESYTIYWDEGPYVNCNNCRVAGTPGDVTTFKFSGLKPGTRYAVNIQCTLVKEDGTKTYNNRVAHGNFVTLPGKVENVKITPASNGKKFTVSWDGQNAVDYEYVISDMNGKKVESGLIAADSSKVTKTKVVFSTDVNLSKKGYAVKVRAFNEIDAKKYTGKWSSTAYALASVKNVSATKSSGKVTVNWSKMNGVKNYTVYASTKKNSGFKAVATSKSGKAAFTKIGSKSVGSSTVYVYVVGSKKVGQNEYTSFKSSVIAVK